MGDKRERELRRVGINLKVKVVTGVVGGCRHLYIKRNRKRKCRKKAGFPADHRIGSILSKLALT